MTTATSCQPHLLLWESFLPHLGLISAASFWPSFNQSEAHNMSQNEEGNRRGIGRNEEKFIILSVLIGAHLRVKPQMCWKLDITFDCVVLLFKRKLTRIITRSQGLMTHLSLPIVVNSNNYTHAGVRTLSRWGYTDPRLDRGEGCRRSHELPPPLAAPPGKKFSFDDSNIIWVKLFIYLYIQY